MQTLTLDFFHRTAADDVRRTAPSPRPRSRRGTLALVLGLGIAGFAVGAVQADDAAAIEAFVASGALDFIDDAAVIDAVRAQNAANAALTQADIDTLDATWRAEIGTAETPTIDTVVGSAVSTYLRAQIEAGAGLFTEVFVMDSHGLNVASASVTSDYWQGDEAKFSETFPKGPGAVHVGEIERDESTMTYQVQISRTLTDPDSGEPIGAATFGVDAEALF